VPGPCPGLPVLVTVTVTVLAPVLGPVTVSGVLAAGAQQHPLVVRRPLPQNLTTLRGGLIVPLDILVPVTDLNSSLPGIIVCHRASVPLAAGPQALHGAPVQPLAQKTAVAVITPPPVALAVLGPATAQGQHTYHGTHVTAHMQGTHTRHTYRGTHIEAHISRHRHRGTDIRHRYGIHIKAVSPRRAPGRQTPDSYQGIDIKAQISGIDKVYISRQSHLDELPVVRRQTRVALPIGKGGCAGRGLLLVVYEAPPVITFQGPPVVVGAVSGAALR